MFIALITVSWAIINNIPTDEKTETKYFFAKKDQNFITSQKNEVNLRNLNKYNLNTKSKRNQSGSGTAFYVGELEEGLRATNTLLERLDKIPEGDHERIKQNKVMYEQAIEQREKFMQDHVKQRKELMEKYMIEENKKVANKQKSYAKARKERSKKRKKARA